MFSRLVAAVAPYLIWIALAAGLALGGSVVGWVQGVRIDRRDLQIERLTQAAATAKQKAEAAAQSAEATIAGLSSDLAIAHKLRRIEYVEVVKEIDRVASGTNQCLAPDTLRVLQLTQDRGNAQGSDTRVAPGAGPRSPANPDRLMGGASEKAIANWMASAMQQYRDLQQRHMALAQAVRALPGVEVEDDR